jgi:2-oxoglutarate ferredoxin oxidoreductase subunit beta
MSPIATAKKTAWCPGCGNFMILKALPQAVEEAGIDPNDLVLVSGIGQAAKLPHYVEASMFNGLHGRAVAHATGIKLANHKLKVVIASGDGDMYGEGGNHFVHAIRRNISVTALVHNNQVYGLTKGQASPTSDPGFTTKIQTHGVISAPFNPIAVAISLGCPFVARTFCGDKDHMRATLVAALKQTDGFALVDILQPCVSFNRVNTYQWYRERCRPVDDSHDPADRAKALELAFTWSDSGGSEIPIGIIYRCDRPSFEAQQPVLQRGTLVEQYAPA